MSKIATKKLRPPRNSAEAFKSSFGETPVYMKLLNDKEIEDFKSSFPNMVDFIGPDGRVHLPVNPEVRIKAIYAYHDIQTAKQYLMRMLHKFKMRGMPQDQIAQLFNVSVRTVARWNSELKQQFVKNSQEIEINHMVGESLDYFNEIGYTAMREMDSATNPMHKARLLETALRSKDSSLAFLDKVGFFTNNQLAIANPADESRRSAERMSEIIAKIFAPTSLEEFSAEINYHDPENLTKEQLIERYNNAIAKRSNK